LRTVGDDGPNDPADSDTVTITVVDTAAAVISAASATLTELWKEQVCS
jgi:hypothetical protein